MKKENENKISSGRILTVEQYFKENPQSIHILNGNPNRLGVMLNGAMIEIGSREWELVKNLVIFHNTLFNEISINYKLNRKK